MRVEATTDTPQSTGADTIVVGLIDDDAPPFDIDGALAALIDSGEARTAPRKLAVAHAEGVRLISVGLGKRDDLDGERARVAAAAAFGRARELGAERMCWVAPPGADDAVVAGLVHGTVLAAYRFDRFKRQRSNGDGEGDEAESGKRDVGSLVVSADRDVADTVRTAEIAARAQNAARDLQNTPANELTPERLGERALEMAAHFDSLTATVEGPERMRERGMGAFLSVAQGSEREPRLIILRHEPPNAQGPLIALVGKGVTFDTGGISLKPSAKMEEMKFDMSGSAAVMETMGALAELEVPVRVIGIIGATENMPSGHATRPGDIVRSAEGTTIEVTNTDAEGRLVLCDCLHLAVQEGAERIVDIATLTGAVVVALGSTYAAVLGTDDDLVARLQAAGESTGERLWRLPLDPEYAKQLEGRYSDIVNAPGARKAGTIVAAEFLHRFTGDVPWAHIDIAGTAYNTGRSYAGKGGTGIGVRLLTELVQSFA
jgi:leucyl aminopeptidase